MEQNVFAEALKTIYKKRDKITQLIEDLENISLQPLEEYYVKLQIVAKEEDNGLNIGRYGSKSMATGNRDISLENLFDGASYNSTSSKVAQKILVLGGAGVGKSTLLQFMTYKWSIGELWKEKFDFVYLISLKTMLYKQWIDTYQDQDLNDSRLRCLAHYTLGLTRDQSCTIPPKTLPWVGDDKNTSRILLLIDGFDEVAHKWSNYAYKELVDEIFEFQNVVLTSRPNVIKNELRTKFDQLIENVGLDKQGVDEYLDRYFKNDNTKKKELLNLFEQNSTIKEICKVPLNIAMICYMWLCSKNDIRLKEITNISVLYQEMINLLSKRFLKKASKKYDPNTPAKVLELKILSHAAYKALTGGGIDVEQDNRAPTFMIPGVVFKQNASAQSQAKMNLENTDGISLQSSINYIEKLEYQEGSTNLKSLYKYGLLKAEGLVSPSSDLLDTELQKQSYSFIHLTFQEYCAAYYLKCRLKEGDSKERSEICRFIGEHRNEPHYAMTLKFMAGIITADQNKENKSVVDMFWGAITCNVDGVIELGIETKAGLILQLLGQANVESLEIDPRIPNKQEIIDFIDAVVLKDIPAFYPLLEESGYITEDIRQGILENFTYMTKTWILDKIKEIAEKSRSSLKAAIENILQELIARHNESEIMQNIKYRRIKIRRFVQISEKLLNKMAEGDKKVECCQYIIEGLSEAYAKCIEEEPEMVELALEKIGLLILHVNLEKQITGIIKLIELVISKGKSSNFNQVIANLLEKIYSRTENNTSTCASIILNEVATLLIRTDVEITKMLFSSLGERPLVKELKYKVIDNLILSGSRTDILEKFQMNENEKFEYFDKLISHLTSQHQTYTIKLINLFRLNYSIYLANYYCNAFEFYKNQEWKVTKEVTINAFMCLTILFQNNHSFKNIEEMEEDVNCEISDEELIEGTCEIISKALKSSNLYRLELDAKKIKHYLILFAKKIESAGYKLADQNQIIQNLDALLQTNRVEINQSALVAYPIFLSMLKNTEELVPQAVEKLICIFMKADKGLYPIALQALAMVILDTKEELIKSEEVMKELLIVLEKRDFKTDQVGEPLAFLLQKIAKKRIMDTELVILCFEFAIKLLEDQNVKVVKAAMETLDDFIAKTEGKTREDLAYRGIKGLLPFMSEKNYKFYAIPIIDHIIKLLEYKDVLFEHFFEDFVDYFKKEKDGYMKLGEVHFAGGNKICGAFPLKNTSNDSLTLFSPSKSAPRGPLKLAIRNILIEIVRLRNEDCLRCAFSLSKEFLKDQEKDSSKNLKYLFVEIIEKAHPSLAAVCLELTEDILQKNQENSVILTTMDTLITIIKKTTREDLVCRGIKSLIPLMFEENYKFYAVRRIDHIVKLIEYKDILFEHFFEDFVDYFKNEKDSDMRLAIKRILYEIVRLRNEKCLRHAFSLSKEFLEDQEKDSSESLKYLFIEIIEKAHPSLAAVCFEITEDIFRKNQENSVALLQRIMTKENNKEIIGFFKELFKKGSILSEQIGDVLFKLLESKSEELRKKAVELGRDLLKDESKDLREAVKISLGRLVSSFYSYSKTPVEYSEYAILLLEQQDEEVDQKTIRALFHFLQSTEEGISKLKLASLSIKKLLHLLPKASQDIKTSTLEVLSKICCMVKKKEIIFETCKEIATFVRSGDEDVKIMKVAIDSLLNQIKMANGASKKDLASETFKTLKHLLSKNNKQIKLLALNNLGKISCLQKDKEIISETFKDVVTVVRNEEEEDVEIMKEAMDCLLNQIKMANGAFKKDLALETTKALMDVLSNNNKEIKLLAVSNLKKVLCLVKDKNMILELFKVLLSVLRRESSPNSEVKIILSKMVAGLKDKDLLTSLLKIIKNTLNPKEKSISQRDNDIFWFELNVTVNLRRIENPAVYSLKREYGILDINKFVSSLEYSKITKEDLDMYFYPKPGSKRKKIKVIKYLEKVLGLGEFMEVNYKACKKFLNIIKQYDSEKIKYIFKEILDRINLDDRELFKTAFDVFKSFF